MILEQLWGLLGTTQSCSEITVKHGLFAFIKCLLHIPGKRFHKINTAKIKCNNLLITKNNSSTKQCSSSAERLTSNTEMQWYNEVTCVYRVFYNSLENDSKVLELYVL